MNNLKINNWISMNEEQPKKSSNYNVILYDEDTKEYEVSTLYCDAEEGLWFDIFEQCYEFYPIAWQELPKLPNKDWLNSARDILN